jgi:hypothetical protein
MSEIARVRDREGRVHSSARESKFVQEGLSDGSLVDLDKEAEDAAADAQNGNDLDAGTVNSGSGKRERAPRKPVVSDSSGVAESTSGS